MNLGFLFTEDFAYHNVINILKEWDNELVFKWY